MKKRCIAVILLWVMITCFGLYIRSIAFADPVSLTFSQLAGAAYAMGSSMGIQWGFTGSAAAAQQQMTGLLQDFAGTSTIEWWGAGEIKAVAGKLAIAQTGYEGVKGVYEHLKDFLDGLIDNERTPIISDGDYTQGDHIEYSESPSPTGFSVVRSGSTYSLYYYGVNVKTLTFGTASSNTFAYVTNLTSTSGTFRVESSGGSRGASFTYNSIDYAGSYIDYQNADKSLYPSALPLEASWQGDWGQAPDTNLEQLIGSIYNGLADLGDIDVTGDIVEPAPGPTPAPTYPPATDILGGINTEIEQGNDVIQGLNDLQDLMEGVNEGINDIDLGVGEAADTISDAVGEAAEEAAQDVIDAIGEQTATLDQTLTETFEGVQDIADALQPGQISPRQFDLRGVFPFCIPFDIHNLLQKFQATPVAPHVELPFVIQSIGFSYTFDLDFSVFDSVAAIMRTVEYIVFAIGLAWATSKVIKW